MAIKVLVASFMLAIVTQNSIAQSSSNPAYDTSRLECVYKLTFQPDSTDNATGTDTQLLSIGQSLSKFESKSFHMHDSAIIAATHLTQATAQSFVDRMMSLPRVTTTYSIYKKAASAQLYCYDRIGTTLYSYKEPDSLFKWVLASDTSTVAGYPCQLATTTFAGRIFEAWFTRQIPISEGPYKFYGLPGLIIKINDSRHHYTYELVRVMKPKTPVVLFLPTQSSTLTTKRELRQGKINYSLSSIERVAAMGNAVTDEDRKKIIERAKKRNNPLELR